MITSSIVWAFRTIIAPASTVQLARDLAHTLSGPAGEGMLETPLMSTDNDTDTITHYISSGMIDSTFADLLPLGEYPGDAQIILDLATQAEYPTTLEAVQEMLASLHVSELPPFEAMASLNLTIFAPQDALV